MHIISLFSANLSMKINCCYKPTTGEKYKAALAKNFLFFRIASSLRQHFPLRQGEAIPPNETHSSMTLHVQPANHHDNGKTVSEKTTSSADCIHTYPDTAAHDFDCKHMTSTWQAAGEHECVSASWNQVEVCGERLWRICKDKL